MPRNAVTIAASSDLTAERSSADLAMERYSHGDDAAFAEVYEFMAPRLYGYFFRRCRNSALAEDLLQRTFLRMHQARGRFEPRSCVAAWAFTIASRLLIDDWRASGREQPAHGEPVEDLAAPCSADETVQAQQLLALINREIERLPAPQRSAFELVKQKGHSLAESAQMLGVSVMAVKCRLHRASQTLHAAVGAPGTWMAAAVD